MAAICGIGSNIGNSGLDDIFVESGIYGPATLHQIMDCTHYKRSVTAHSVMLLALYELMFESFVRKNPHVRGPCVNISKEFETTLKIVNNISIGKD